MKQIQYLLFVTLALGNSAWAADGKAAETAVAPIDSGNFYTNILIVVFIIAGLFLLWFATAILRAFKAMSAEYLNPNPYIESAPQRMMEYEEWKAFERAKPALWTKVLQLKPLEEEKDIVLDHEFDGITELDNPTPAWFNSLFAVSIVFALGYFLTFEVFGWGPDQVQEYHTEMQVAKQERDSYLAKSANNIDENTVKESTEEPVLAAGMSLYNANCVACHGDKGQGLVGPNLTDEFWLHGGDVSSIFKTIKYGVPEKGMISWEKTLTPKQISDVPNYILSLKGTNPAGAKAPPREKAG